MSDPNLYARRLAYRALELVLDQHGLKSVHVNLNPDDPSQALPGPEGEVRFYLDNGALVNAYRSGREVAWVTFPGETSARVVVPRIASLLRLSHRKNFRPGDVGVAARPGLPELDLEVDVADIVAEDGERMRLAPPRPPLPRTRSRVAPPRVLRAFGGR